MLVCVKYADASQCLHSSQMMATSPYKLPWLALASHHRLFAVFRDTKSSVLQKLIS